VNPRQDGKQPLSPSCPRETVGRDGRPPASYSLVILRRARWGYSGFAVADEPGQWGAVAVARGALPPAGLDGVGGLCGPAIEVFFPAKGHSAAAAKAVCAVCSVRTECYDYAQSFTDTPAGVWGGESERSRKRFAGVPCSCPVGQVEPCQSTVILARAVQRQWRWRDSNPRPPEFQ
jgi:hypothetical protein